MKASVLIALADNADQKDPTAKDILRKAFDDAEAAERGWARKLKLFKKALAWK